MNRLSIIAAVLLCSCSVASMAKIREVRNDFNKTTSFLLTPNELKGSVFDMLNAQVYFDPFYYKPDDKSGSFFIQVQFQSEGWLFIRDGESLGLIVDGEVVKLSGPGSSRDRKVTYGRHIREIALYPITPDLLRRLASATTVRVRVDGANLYVEREFGPANFENLQTFVARFCPGL